MTIEQQVAEHPFFAGLAAPTIAVLAGCGADVHIPAGEQLFRAGESADGFYAIRSGRVTIELSMPVGGGAVLDAACSGDVVGWSWLIAPYRWMFDARATEGTDAIRFDAERLRAACDADPAVGYAVTRRITQVMAHRLQSARIRLLDLYGEVHD